MVAIAKQPERGEIIGDHLGHDLMRDPKSLSPEELIIADILFKATGREAVAFQPITGRGFSNEVMLVSTPEGRLVVRTNKVSQLARYQKEAWCLEQAHSVGIPVPPVLAFGVEGELAYSIAHYIEGSDVIHGGLDRLRVWTTLGRYMVKLNSIPIRGYGSEMQSEGCFKSSWESELGSELAIIFRDGYWEQEGLLSRSKLTNVRAALERCASIQAPPGICHFDLGCENALICNQDYDQIYLLDLELAYAGPVPHFQLACVAKDWGHASSIMKAFSTGYGLSDSTIGEIEPDLNRLIVLKHMRSVRWAQDRSPKDIRQFSENSKSAIAELLAKEPL